MRKDFPLRSRSGRPAFTCVWYPVKDLKGAREFCAAVARTVAAHSPSASRDQRCLRVDLSIGRAADGGLQTAGLLVVNPPWTLAGELKTVLPALTTALGRAPTARFSVEPL